MEKYKNEVYIKLLTFKTTLIFKHFNLDTRLVFPAPPPPPQPERAVRAAAQVDTLTVSLRNLPEQPPRGAALTRKR